MEQTKTDATETSSTSPDVTEQNSSTANDVKDTTLTAEEQQALTGNEDSSTETGQEAEDQQKTQSDGEETEQTTEEEVVPEPQEPPTVDKEGDAKLGFAAHPRWKELVGEKNTYKQEIEQLKPAADQSRALNDFLSQNQIQPQEFQTALKYLKALRDNPQEAFAMIKPTFKQLAALVGEDISPELQAEVAAGTLSIERAQQITRSEAQQTYNRWKQTTQQQVQQGGQTTLVQQTIGMWAQAKMGIDANFKEGTPLWELVDTNLRGMQPATNPQEAQANAEKAYSKAKSFLGGLQPVPKTPPSKRPPQTQSASRNPGQVIRNSNDAVKLIQANGGKAPPNVSYA